MREYFSKVANGLVRQAGLELFIPPAPELPERLGPVQLTHVGELTRWNQQEVFERIVAGDLIPDSERTVFTERDKNPLVDLPFVEGAYSGSMGMIDFRIIHYPHDKEQKFDSLYIQNVGVEPQYRRRGVGQQLVRAVEDLARAKGIGYLWAYVSRRDEDTVLKMMEGLGYRIGNRNDMMDFRIVKSLGEE